ncbi:MAG: tRNA uridine-5-carboxymethylaminomethyl(34) synthesis enzyme MnmG, partial [Sphaerochaetaceae bacterium]|nr:tRNA uridine-5-carboxymethylaminomethyl(34) synthesis enzyme MnmG [Sphaerochaetaceae bacterium]
YEVGLATDERLGVLQEKMSKMESLQDLIKHRGYGGKNALDSLKNPEITMDNLAQTIPEINEYPVTIRQQLELKIKYDGYIKKQDRQVDRFSKLENIRIPQTFDYDKVEGISAEAKEKFKLIKPESVGQASRISGVRVSDISVLLLYLRK